VMNGSSGSWLTIQSMSETAKACAPPTMPSTEVPMEEPSWRRRRVLRRAKKSFHVSWPDAAFVDEAVGEAAVAVDA
jgi:hypothetical protein